MKTGLATQLGQQLHLTPQLLQSIRLLQLDGLQLEMEIRRALELNPLLELEEEQSAESPTLAADSTDTAAVETAAFDELPESNLWDIPGASWNEGDDDRMQRIEAGESSDPQVRVLAKLSLELSDADLQVAAFWLEHTDDAGYLVQEPASLAMIAAAQHGVSAEHAEILRQRILHGEYTGLAARDLRECLLAQLAGLAGHVPGRPIAQRIIESCLDLLGSHDYDAIATRLDLDADQVRDAVRLILSLQPRPGEALVPEAAAAYVIPDVVAWHADCAWRVALNPATTPRLSVMPMHERALERADQQNADQSAGAQKLRELLQEARWLTRGLSMRYDTLLRTARAIVERQAGFLSQGDEAMAPLTLKEIADEIGMHESTISRITTGKYMQTPRGTFELKHFFAVRLEGASVSGPAVRAMVRRLIESEPAGKPLADEAIAGLLARQGIHIARRTVAKYREQLDIAPARQRRHGNVSALAKAG
ncbi:RNA polymerase factor sigma-54 [Pseudoxanthomonas sp. UTMC 1351]|uniref:RNA polymerase factor sigma-54 n=1 Tax=Pseudoxanthomonas sp. UTMC 1351 TaxID=2695853 RepID=UPI0034CE2954